MILISLTEQRISFLNEYDSLRHSMSFKVLNPNEFFSKLKSAKLAYALPTTEILEQCHRYSWIEHVEDGDIYMSGKTQPSSSEYEAEPQYSWVTTVELRHKSIYIYFFNQRHLSSTSEIQEFL